MRGLLRKTLFSVAAALAVLAVLTALTLPRPVLRGFVTAATPWLISDGSAGRVAGAYVEGQLASHLADRVVAAAEPDHVALERMVSAVRDQVLNPSQLLHHPHSGQALLAGFGYCDQINAAIARVAAHRFGSAQLFALYDAGRRTSPHTVGRVWSDERGTWLYFDGFFDVPVIYAKRGDGSIEYMPVSSTPAVGRGAPLREYYRLGGWVMNEYRATFIGYLATRAVNRLGFGNIEAPPPQKPVAVASGPAPPPKEPVDPNAFERVARQYFAVRLQHLLWEAPAAGDYTAIAGTGDASKDWRASRMAAAARVFASRR